MKTILYTLFLFILLPMSKAQYHEVGLYMGATNYLGDLVPPNQFFLGTSFSTGAYYQYHFTNRISVRGSILYGQLRGDDANSTFDSGRKQRNLDFKTHLLEFSAIGYVSILPYHPKRAYRPITPYVFAGVALFHFNPYTTYAGEQVFLQPLGTEGQGIEGYAPKYSLWEFAIPLGLGVKFSLHNKVNISIEFGIRKTFTDYIDDASGDYVNLQTIRQYNGNMAANLSNRTYDTNGNQIELQGSPRGLPGKDWYSYMGITISYNIINNNTFFKKKRRKNNPNKTKKKKKDGGKWM